MEKNKKDNTLCEICEEIANNLCFKCEMYLCEQCFRYIHSKDKNKSHKKEPLDSFIPIQFKCHIHPKNPINLFCSDEKSNKIIINFFIYSIGLSIM